ncbi:hypothetical protein [Scytonema sp. HK-05]|uniref:hypothetical protein n=1 Tax=Scytonema sp. HK-05 TaxID=1137095 RepID=UPI001301047A|nr:hypothetical protein [Scytonema sp. HK-05]
MCRDAPSESSTENSASLHCVPDKGSGGIYAANNLSIEIAQISVPPRIGESADGRGCDRPTHKQQHNTAPDLLSIQNFSVPLR